MRQEIRIASQGFLFMIDFYRYRDNLRRSRKDLAMVVDGERSSMRKLCTTNIRHVDVAIRFNISEIFSKNPYEPKKKEKRINCIKLWIKVIRATYSSMEGQKSI